MQLLLLLLLLSRLAWYELIVRLSIHHPIETGVVRVVVIWRLFPRRQVGVVESCVWYEVVGVVHAEQGVRLRVWFSQRKRRKSRHGSNVWRFSVLAFDREKCKSMTTRRNVRAPRWFQQMALPSAVCW